MSKRTVASARRGRVFFKLMLLLAAMAAFLWWGNNSLVAEHFTVASDRLPEGFDGFCIVQLSDLHEKEFGADHERLLSAVAAQEPDLIAVTGDLVDRFKGENPAYVDTLCRKLVEIAPVYFVTGNHEWAVGNVPALKQQLTDLGVTVLSNQFIELERGGELAKDTIVGTVMSNLGLTMMGRENGIEILQTAVGDRYVLERMLADGYNIGGEQSGHVIFLDYNSTGDGVLTAIQLLSVLKRSGKKASELADVMQVLPQVLVNARVNNAKKNNYMDDEVVRKGIEELEQEFSQDGRVLIRTSGTEPLVRVMIEGKDIEKMDKAARKLASLIEERLK